MIKSGTRTRGFSSITPLVSVTRWKIYSAVISDKHQQESRAVLPGWDEAGQFLSSGVARGTIERVTYNHSDGKRGRKELLYRYTKTFRGSKVHDLGIFRSTAKWYSTQLVSNFHMLKICWKLHEHTNKSIQKVLCFKKFAAVKNFSQIWQRKITFLKILGGAIFRPFSKSLLLLSSGGGEG